MNSNFNISRTVKFATIFRENFAKTVKNATILEKRHNRRIEVSINRKKRSC